MPDDVAIAEARARAERRAVALRGAAELVARCDDVDRIASLLALAGGHGRLLRAIERARVVVRVVDTCKMNPDAALWSQAADKMIASDSKYFLEEDPSLHR